MLPFGPLVLNRTGRVVGLDPGIAGVEVVSVSGLVAKAPDYYARMVEVPLYHPAVAGQMGGLEILPLCQGPVTVPHSVGFDIAFVNNIQSVLVAQGVPPGVVGIVAGTHRIDIQFLHYTDIPDHIRLRYHISFLRIHLVPVGSLDKDLLPVYQELGSLHLDSPESEIYGSAFEEVLLFINGELQRIQVGGFSTPERRLRDPAGKPHFQPGRDSLSGCNRESFLVENLVGHLGDTDADISLDGIRAIHISHDVDVLDPFLLPGIHEDIPGDPGEPPEILVLEIRTVAPTEYLQSNQVLAGLDIFRDVETCLQFAVFAVTDLLAVDPYPDIRSGGADIEADLLLEP